MARLLQANRATKRVGDIVRTWWAMRCQKRRRHSQPSAPVDVPPAPTITSGGFYWNGSDQGWAYVDISWTFDAASYPTGTMEVFAARGVGSQDFQWIGSSALEGIFTHERATDEPLRLTYKVRCVAGGVPGLWSNQSVVDVV